jgi:hypothetical protein
MEWCSLIWVTFILVVRLWMILIYPLWLEVILRVMNFIIGIHSSLCSCVFSYMCLHFVRILFDIPLVIHHTSCRCWNDKEVYIFPFWRITGVTVCLQGSKCNETINEPRNVIVRLVLKPVTNIHNSTTVQCSRHLSSRAASVTFRNYRNDVSIQGENIIKVVHSK